MLRLEDLDLVKITLFAIGLPSVLLSIANYIGIFDISHLDIKTLNTRVIIGGIIFGLLFGVAGTCSRTCVGAASGSNFKKAISTILCGLLSAFAFSISYGYLNERGLISGFNLGNMTLFNLSPKYPSVFNIGFIGLFIVVILFMLGGYLLPKSIIKK
ncbi:Uncharacterised protein [uncultured Clostridium sp.]|nr:Uncharacterised protein [uncultured Clostridium sp.]